MSLDIKAGVLTLISPVMKISPISLYLFAHKTLFITSFINMLRGICYTAARAVPLSRYIFFLYLLIAS